MVLCTVFHRLLISLTRGRKKHKDNSEQSNTVSFPGTGRSLFGKRCAPPVRKLREKSYNSSRACQGRLVLLNGKFWRALTVFSSLFTVFFEEMGRNQRLRGGVSEMASDSGSSARDAQEWAVAVPCPTSGHAYGSQGHGYGCRALKTQLKGYHFPSV